MELKGERMSRSRSPNFRRFPCQESSFDPHKVPSHPEENPHNRGHRPRPSPEEDWGFDREEMSPPSPEDRFQIEHQRRPDVEKFYHRASSPPYDARAFEGRRPSPPHGVGGDSDRRRDGFQDQRCDNNRGRSPHSPPSLVRERLPARSQADPQQRAPGVGWREEQSRGPGRFRDLSPASRTDNQRSGAARERGRRSLQGPNRDRQREEPHQERSPPFKRQRREMDDADHPGSLPSYSTERQLSLDLVNVGRQRLDFLPMLEHSGTYQEKAVQTGTFAQEIITLVHQVKEQYFRDDGLTLNERFSVPQTSSFSEEETVELTLDERFSSNRGFSLNMKLLHDDDEPLFSRLESTQGLNQQLVRDPGDLRHDLERRRQERLEGVMVTIQGGGMSQRPLGQVSEPEFIDDMSPLEDVRFSTWPEEQSRRQEGNMVPRRGASFRPSSASQHRNNHFINQAGPMRRQNNRRYPEGPTW